MFQVPVVVVQSSANVFASVDEYVWTFRRFAEVAKAKEARLVVFPELTGLMLAPPLMAGVKSSLARTAGRGREKQAPILQKARGLLAGSVAGVLRANLPSQMAKWFSQPANVMLLEQTYREVFSRIAAEMRLTVVAGSCYCARPPGTDIYNTAHIFGPDGSLIGTQDQTHLIAPVLGELSAGDRLTPIQTETGSLGLLLGNDVLFPEAARILAYQGAEVLICLNAAPGNLAAAKLQQAFQSRVAENEAFGVQSFLVGRNLWAERPTAEVFVGRSMIAGPMELVPRPHGVMSEMGESVQGVLAGVLDITALHRWWADGATSVRRAMRPGVYQGQLARYYRAGQTIHAAQMVQRLQQEEAAPTSRTGPWAGAIPREQAAPIRMGSDAAAAESAAVESAEEPSQIADATAPPLAVPEPASYLEADGTIAFGTETGEDANVPPGVSDTGELSDDRLKLWD